MDMKRMNLLFTERKYGYLNHKKDIPLLVSLNQMSNTCIEYP